MNGWNLAVLIYDYTTMDTATLIFLTKIELLQMRSIRVQLNCYTWGRHEVPLASTFAGPGVPKRELAKLAAGRAGNRTGTLDPDQRGGTGAAEEGPPQSACCRAQDS